MKIIYFAPLVLAVALQVSAQVPFSEMVSATGNDYTQNVFLYSAHESFKKEIKKGEVSAEDLKVEKLGLLTFSLFELNHKKSKSLLVYTYQKDGKSLIQRVYDESISLVRDSISKYGVELLLPEEYLDSEAKRVAYREGVQKLKAALGKKVDLYETLDANTLSNTPDGYEYIASFADQGENEEVKNIVSVLCRIAGLDGLLSIQLSTTYFNYSIAFSNTLMMIHTPYPVEDPKNGNGLMFASYFYMPQAPVGFIGLEKGEVSGEDLSGFPILLSRMSGDFMNFLNVQSEYAFSK